MTTHFKYIVAQIGHAFDASGPDVLFGEYQNS